MNKFFPIAGFLLTIACSQKAAPDEYLIPADFAGKVNILFGRSDGATKAYEDGWRVYQIPPDGILVTQLPATAGFVDRKYFSVDPAGGWTPLK